MFRHRPAVDITAYLPFVRAIAAKFAKDTPRWLTSFDDLVQEGALALLRAGEAYDPTRGATFTTFAYRRVRGAMTDHLRATWRAHGHGVPAELPDHGRTSSLDADHVRAAAITVKQREHLLTDRQRDLVFEWAIGEMDADRARAEGKHRSAITRERHAALDLLSGRTVERSP
jgi:RNA polymerase sigma factor (sigma-70 family)